MLGAEPRFKCANWLLTTELHSQLAHLIPVRKAVTRKCGSTSVTWYSRKVKQLAQCCSIWSERKNLKTSLCFSYWALPGPGPCMCRLNEWTEWGGQGEKSCLNFMTEWQPIAPVIQWVTLRSCHHAESHGGSRGCCERVSGPNKGGKLPRPQLWAFTWVCSCRCWNFLATGATTWGLTSACVVWTTASSSPGSLLGTQEKPNLLYTIDKTLAAPDMRRGPGLQSWVWKIRDQFPFF